MEESIPTSMKRVKLSSPEKPKGADPDKPKMTKAKDIRRQKALAKQTKVKKAGNDNKEKSLKDYLDEPFPLDSKHKFEKRTLLAQRSNPAFEATFEETHKLYQKYQTKIHKDSPSKCSPNQCHMDQGH